MPGEAVSPAKDIATVPCTACRKRRVKCDKRLPGCRRCAKSSQPCPGYNKLRSFLDQGAALREKYGEQQPREQTQSAKPGASASPLSDAASLVPTPKSVDIETSPPALEHSTVSPNVSYTTNGDSQNALSGHLDFDHLSDSAYDGASESYDAAFFDLDPDVYFAEGNNCCGWVPNLTFVEDAEVPTLSWRKTIASQNFSESLTDEGMQITDIESSTSSESQREADYETAHLIQHFSQHISPFLDVFDAERYFGHVVPIKALQSSLLTNSLAAIAAKQFAKTRREDGNGNNSSLARLALTRDQTSSNVDWFYKAASFYDKAICQMLGLLQSLSDGDCRNSRSPAGRLITGPRTNTPNSLAGSPQTKRRRSEKRDAPTNAATILDDLLAAVSVFLLYESLDNRQLETLNHMSGAQSLLSKNIPSSILNQRAAIRPGMLTSIDTSKAWQATFWNVARIDYIVAYTESTMPRLNTGDEQLWKAAGLPLVMDNGLLQPESICRSESLDYDSLEMTEAVACKALIWIVLRSLAYVTAEKSSQNRTSDYAPTQTNLLTGPETWYSLRQLLANWHDALPDTFQPFVALPKPQQFHPQASMNSPSSRASNDKTITIQFPTLCYSSAMASTAMVVYHFIQIFLLLHKPLARTPSESLARFTSKRMDAYRQTVYEIDDHASAVCGISLNRPIDAVQMHMAQPLHMAGLCFDSAGQQVVLEGLLNGIEKSTGCSTEWIVNSLRDEWGSNGVPADIEPIRI